MSVYKEGSDLLDEPSSMGCLNWSWKSLLEEASFNLSSESVSEGICSDRADLSKMLYFC